MLLVTLDNITEIGFRLLLWLSYLYLNKLAPYIRHIEEEELWYYRYPSHTSIFPIRYLYVMMVCVPLLIYSFCFICRRKDTSYSDMKNQFYGISLAYCINGVLSAILKLVIGRPRPNFFYRCFPDGVGIEIQDCTGEWEGQMDGRKSFPSGHASFSFTGMVYITCYIFNEFDFAQPCFARGVIFFFSLMPMLLAILVSLTRVCDYHHHMSDVVGGGMIGSAIALFVFHFYKEINTEKTRKYHEDLEKLIANRNIQQTTLPPL